MHRVLPIGTPVGAWFTQPSFTMHTGIPAPQDRHGATVVDLSTRAVHCCYGGCWPSRLGGVAALQHLVPRLPAASLPRLAPLITRAVFAVLRHLPEHAAEEPKLQELLLAVLQRCSSADAAAAAATATPGEGSKAVAPGAGEAAATPSSTTAAGDGAASPGSPADGLQLPALLKQLMEIFVQHLLSSRSSTAVRMVASAGLQVRLHALAVYSGCALAAVWARLTTHLVLPSSLPTLHCLCLQALADLRSASVAALLKPITKALDGILDRRLLPIRSITTQASVVRLGAWLCCACASRNNWLLAATAGLPAI